MTPQDIFDGLRTLLHDAPTRKGFDAVLALLRKGKALDPDLCEAVWHPYAVEHIAHWRDQIPLRAAEWRFEAPSPEYPLADPISIEKDGCAVAETCEPDMLGFGLARTLRLFGPPYTRTRPLTEIARFVSNPSLASLQGLELGNIPLPPKDFKALVDSPHLTNLTALALTRCGVERPHAEALAKTRRLRHLKTLILQWSQLGDGLEALAGSRTLRGLRHLAVPNNQLHADNVAVLARGRLMSKLQTLDLSFNPNIGHAGAVALAKFADPRSLHTLRIARTALRHGGFKAIVQSPWFTAVRHFQADNNMLPPQSLKALVRQTNTQLDHLSLDNNHVGGPGAAHLASWPGVRHLRTLLLSRTQLGDEGIEELVHGSHPLAIEVLDVSGNDLTETSAALLAKSPMMDNCRALRLDNNFLGAKGIRRLCQAPWISKLEHLSLNNTGFNYEDAAFMARTEAFRGLKTLSAQLSSLAKDHLRASPYTRHLLE